MTRTDDLTSQVNGARTEFTTPVVFVFGTLEAHINGVRQEPTVHFEEIGTTGFRMFEAPAVADTLLVQYEVVGPGDTFVFPTVSASGIDPGRA